MKGITNLKIKIGNRTLKVEIADLHARPIIAIVDGEPIEVWPQNDAASSQSTAKQSADNGQVVKPAPSVAASVGVLSSTLRAPIPGTVLSVEVEAGEEVAAGQELLVIEAMKMKNILRAGRAGTIASVKVFAGQTVKHNDVLVEFAE
jgi:biotin carboxyl carrier protein